MTDVFVVSDNILSPLGSTTGENFARLKEGRTGIGLYTDAALSPEPFYAAMFGDWLEKHLASVLPRQHGLTRFESILIASIHQALEKSGIDPGDPETLLIISTTKGNIGLLEAEQRPQQWKELISLPASAARIAGFFSFTNPPLTVSNACISGSMGIITGMRLIRSGRYRHAIVAGADLVTRFVLSGFQSFQAVSAEPCRPFDKDRTGISLGEAAATVILSRQPAAGGKPQIKVTGGFTGNDANHISGPSRTGMELAHILQKTLAGAAIAPSEVDFISAHGTATPYNDEMEAKAISIAGMENVPVNSLKGYYGHTLGAAGLVESVITLASMREDLVLPTMGCREPGVSKPVNIVQTLQRLPLHHCLKTASGFGGCNAAILFSKT